MNYKKFKLLTITGFVSVVAISANAGGIHCDDDPKCLPCVPGVACHNSVQANSDFAHQLSDDDFLEITGEEAKDLFDSMTGKEVSERIVYGSRLSSIVYREAPTNDGQMLTCSEIHHGIGLKYGTYDYRCTQTKVSSSNFMHLNSSNRGCSRSLAGWICPGDR